MKLKTLLLAAVTACATVAFAAESAPLTFNGVLTLGKEQRYGLASPTATRSGWLKIGSEFEGYTLQSYDTTTRRLTVARDGKTYELALESEKMDGKVTQSTPATLADAEAVLGQLQFEKMIEKSIEGQQAAMAKMMRQMGGRDGVSTDDMIEHQKKVMAVMLEAMNPEQMKKEMTQIYSEMFSKEELQAMAQFNSTRAGQAMIEKMPDIQQRTQELMMPRIMAAMPKIQEMGKEFFREQQEKKAKAAPATPGAPTPPAAPAAPKNP
jgi:uncharacterized protein